MAPGSTNQSAPEVMTAVRAAVARARAGDAAAVPELRGHLDRHPEIWRTYGDLAALAAGAWTDLAAGPDLHLRECLGRFAKSRRAELTRPGAAPAEVMLVGRVVACGLQVEYFSALEAKSVAADDPPKLHQWWARRHAQAQRAFQAAVASLLTVQKLFPIPPVRAAAPAVVGESQAATTIVADEAPATVPAQAEGQPEVPAFQSTHWAESTDEPAPAPSLVRVRA